MKDFLYVIDVNISESNRFEATTGHTRAKMTRLAHA